MGPRGSEPLALRKERGAFFTPPALAEFLVRWAVRSADERVLEPSCGEAAFLAPAGERLRELGGKKRPAPGQLSGIELHHASSVAASELLEARGYGATLQTASFFDVAPPDSEAERYDAVIGNPPYIRYQQFAGDERAKALRAALASGVRLTRLASSWAAFLVHATRFLKQDGRLGLVLPAELLTVNYAAPVRRFLLQSLRSVRLVLFEELVFPGVLEEVVLLMAEGRGSAPSFEVVQVRGLQDLESSASDARAKRGFAPKGEEKWTPALLSGEAFARYRELSTGPAFEELKVYGETYLGAVTGDNRFFALNQETARAARLAQRDLVPISPPGSKHLRGLAFTRADWRRQAELGAACQLFYPAREDKRRSRPAERWIAAGEARGVQNAYKCRVRTPWWRVPTVPTPDLFLTYMDHERPRLVANRARVGHLNSLYGVKLRHERKRLAQELLPLAALNSVTLLGAEVVGRSYGGGLLKLEPREADRLPLPAATLLAGAALELRRLRAPVEAALGAGELALAVELVDRELLERGLGLSGQELAELQSARQVLFARRTARARGGSGTHSRGARR
jgi:adenine-specific DNA methylase